MPTKEVNDMNCTNTCYFQHRKIKQNTRSKTFYFIYNALVVISTYLVFGLLFQYVYASGVEKPDPYQSQHGSVWLLNDSGVYTEAMQIQTDVDYEITANIARAKVKQKFKNNTSLWTEGIYVFPLPEKSAVDHFRMIIGERVIEGQIKERVSAKKTYEAARLSGKKASIIEQQRPNVFTTSLANIAPGEEIIIEFEFQQLLEYKDDSYRLRFPMVVAPRYHPGKPSLQSLINPAINETSVYTETDPVNNQHNPTRIHLVLDAGVSLYDLNSTYHRININQSSDTRYIISTLGENIVSEHDFELVWKPQLNNSPQFSAFNEKINEENEIANYTMLTILPPDLSHLQQKIQARDVVFVIDVSGSMAGTSITQAKAALITALDALSSIDRFNVIWFNNNSGSLYPESLSASQHNISNAKQFINNLEAVGGTEMRAAMKLALSAQQSFSRFRQVIFITDGNISNETELFSIIDQQLGNSRLFTIGIGSAPNSYFMRQAAQQGRGTFTYIGNNNEVHKKTTALFKKLETPALINIQLSINNQETDNNNDEIFPKIIPDLYAGETANILIKSNQTPKNISLKADYGNTEWQISGQLTNTSSGGIRVAWAREKIASLMNLKHQAKNDIERESIKQKITNTALQHHLVSRYTSLLAVDVTPVNNSGELYKKRLKNNLPQGWKNTASTNHLMLAQAATSSKLNLLLALIFFISAALLYQWNKYKENNYA